MPKYICKVYWEVSAEVEVEASNKEQAALEAEAAPMSHYGHQTISDEFNCDPETDVQLKK